MSHRAPARWRIRGSLFALLTASALVAPLARADRTQTDAARIDWAAGLVTAGGTGIADRHAPSPAVALGTSRRGADQAARQRIADKLSALPLASGGTLATKRGDAAIQARIAAALEAAVTVSAEPETDGSWHVTLGVPIEALRQAIAGPRALPATGDAGPAVVVVEGVTAKPAIGWTIGGAAAATIWVKEVPAWAKDAPRIRATAAKAGEIAVDGNPGGGATLYVLVTRS
ncbi:MAG: hypothetical protein ABIY55_29655 [Kofleriaceae bacterium]